MVGWFCSLIQFRFNAPRDKNNACWHRFQCLRFLGTEHSVVAAAQQHATDADCGDCVVFAVFTSGAADAAVPDAVELFTPPPTLTTRLAGFGVPMVAETGGGHVGERPEQRVPRAGDAVARRVYGRGGRHCSERGQNYGGDDR